MTIVRVIINIQQQITYKQIKKHNSIYLITLAELGNGVLGSSQSSFFHLFRGDQFWDGMGVKTTFLGFQTDKLFYTS